MAAKKMSDEPKASDASTSKARKRGISKQEFAEHNDYDTKTRVAIRRVLKSIGHDEVLKDCEFRSECGVASSGWRQIAEEEEFLPCQFQHDGKNFWARPQTVAWVLDNVAKAKRLE